MNLGDVISTLGQLIGLTLAVVGLLHLVHMFASRRSWWPKEWPKA